MATPAKGGLGKRPTPSTSRLIPTGESDLAPTTAAPVSPTPTTLDAQQALAALAALPLKTEKADFIRKSLTLPPELNERLRLFCFEKKAKDMTVLRDALADFLTRNGY